MCFLYTLYVYPAHADDGTCHIYQFQEKADAICAALALRQAASFAWISMDGQGVWDSDRLA